MPNGRSGGFRITKGRLRAMLESQADDIPIAKTLHLSGTAAEILGALESYPDDEVVVEQQDNSWYTIWLDPAFKTGDLDGSASFAFMVDEQSPIFPELIDRHRQWLESLEDPPTTEGRRRRVMWLIVISLILGGMALLVTLLK